jgi:hypothetical protein
MGGGVEVNARDRALAGLMFNKVSKSVEYLIF